MTDATLAPAAAGYLAQLEAALAAVDPATRDEILAGVREELVGLDAAAVTARIRELGDPEFIAAEARAAAVAGAASTSAGVPDAADAQPLPQAGVAASARPEPVGLSITAAILVMIGGIVVPVVGALAGYALVWISTAWNRRQKLGATLVPLAVLAVIVVAASIISTVPSSVSTDELAAGEFQLNPLMPAAYDIVWSGVLLLAGFQVLVGIWLLVIARRNWATRA